ncbi:response regulator transcription factor [Micromonospora sp. WMMA1363]|uniref:helix-turn-helix transcriptional regulator n=1 Tax=Micromonospora sp. WMMA1363 TaxID=3053985 RepID=UPI00259CCC74|nr:response regulator transcription factor [Micromonospora sp. WMMA1363]MDM4718153.1 response regulator transcription factor [Micromonospora sp. WMMA1363]
MSRKRSAERVAPATGFAPFPVRRPAGPQCQRVDPPPREPVRAVLAGEWSAARTEALRVLLTVVDDPGTPVDWLLLAVGVGPPPRTLPWPAQPRRPRVGVVDPGCRWPAGADSDVYLAGDVEPGELVAALRLAGTGFSIRRVATSAGLPAGLTGREVELLRALCAGLGNDQIARRLHISRSTVEFHLTRIFRKLEVSSRAEAIVRALRYDPGLAAAALR